MIRLLLLLLLFPSISSATTTTFNCSADTSIRQFHATTNYGSNTSVTIETTSDGALYKFDLSSIAGATVSSATFTVNQVTRGGSHNITAYRLLRTDWVESQATYNIYKTSNNWGTAGALNTSTDYTTTNSNTQANANGGNVAFDVTSMIADVTAGGAFGGIIIRNASSDDTFNTLEGGSTATLSVTYTLASTQSATNGFF